MMHCLLACSQSIYRTAKAFAVEYRAATGDKTGSTELGADLFFPLWLYVIVHARLPDVHRRLAIMTAYAASDAMSEKGYYLTCLEGAILFVMNATPDSFKQSASPKKKKS